MWKQTPQFCRTLYLTFRSELPPLEKQSGKTFTNEKSTTVTINASNFVPEQLKDFLKEQVKDRLFYEYGEFFQRTSGHHHKISVFLITPS